MATVLAVQRAAALGAAFRCPRICSKHAHRSVEVLASQQPDHQAFDLSNYVEAKIAHVRHTKEYGHQMVLKLAESDKEMTVYVGEFETAALVKEINQQRTARPMTHDLMKNTVEAMGYRVSKVCVTALVGNTYHASIHYLKTENGVSEEVVLDARPSDALNMAVRFKSVIYVNKEVASKMAQAAASHREETTGEIVHSVRKAILQFSDPTVMHKIKLEMAVQQERYDDAAQIRDEIDTIMSTNRAFRIRVAMETALDDERYMEAASLRDELLRLQDNQQASQASD
eukprot:jgi/Tetstr1/455382/TSEL_042214.t1